jgi:hypothetical protein
VDLDDRTPGVRHEVTADDPLVPVIWPHRVRWIEFVGPDKLEEWQRVMAEEVKAQPVGAGGEGMAKPGCETTSGSWSGWDDSDYWGRGC